MHTIQKKVPPKRMCACIPRSQWSPRSRPWRVIEITQEGDRAAGPEAMVMRTPESRNKGLHCQKFLRSETRVWDYGSRIS